mmetsp:Transcript_240/g.550  ORF Transcript_240/g.550 Transcript_240/m.550 type:complete len:82 (-) Transcript_240:1020-1265(-)
MELPDEAKKHIAADDRTAVLAGVRGAANLTAYDAGACAAFVFAGNTPVAIASAVGRLVASVVAVAGAGELVTQQLGIVEVG